VLKTRTDRSPVPTSRAMPRPGRPASSFVGPRTFTPGSCSITWKSADRSAGDAPSWRRSPERGVTLSWNNGTMAIEIDTSRDLRGVSDLQALVAAVVAAHEHDESDWLEWKLDLELSTKEGCLAVARNVLGMANRQPDRAAIHCGGLGFVVVGAAPGTLSGINSVDPADLSQSVDPYLGGAAGPRWTPTVVSVGGKSVLVATVEAPHQGDPIFTLRRATQKYQAGTIFVRKHGRTVPADADDIDALQARLVARLPSGAELEVSLLGEEPLSWIDLDTARTEIDAWIDQQHAAMVEEARAVAMRREDSAARRTSGFTVDSLGNAPGTSMGALRPFLAGDPSLPSRLVAMGGFLSQPDSRTLEDYISQVDAWRDETRETANRVVPERYFSLGHGALQIRVSNLSRRFLEDVEVNVDLPWEGVTIIDQQPGSVGLPVRPRPFGESSPSPIMRATTSLTSIPYLGGITVPPPPRRAQKVNDRSRVRFRIGNLRQSAIEDSETIYLFGINRPGIGVVVAQWTATIRVPDEVLNGVCEIRIARDPTDVASLLDADFPVDD
jgi:hypothetical protein